jgi:formylglycine-generating enzyme required for sulfatase activity
MTNRRLLALAALAVLAACTPAKTQTAEKAPAPVAAPSSAPAERDPRVFRDCADCPEMVRVPAGSFMMGSPSDDPDRRPNEGPQHRVVIAKPFAISAYEISTGEYRRFIESTGRKEVEWKMAWTWHSVGAGPEPMEPDLFPVTAVSWQDAQDYAAWLSQQTGRHYRLPTEAEWEYVARAGDPAARFEPDALRRPLPGWETDQVEFHYPVMAFAANAFGVHGLTANMEEWLEDCYVENYDHAPADGSAVKGTCKQRSVRGSYKALSPNVYERIASRDWAFAANRGSGIRLARDLP